MTKEIWYTAEIAVETPRGRRWKGVCYTPGGRFWKVRRSVDSVGDRLPPKAIVRYESPLRVARNEAYEQARSRTIHHNVFHDGSQWAGMRATVYAHNEYRCAEGRLRVTSSDTNWARESFA